MRIKATESPRWLDPRRREQAGVDAMMGTGRKSVRSLVIVSIVAGRPVCYLHLSSHMCGIVSLVCGCILMHAAARLEINRT